MVRLRLDDAGTRVRTVEVLESNHPLFEPTSGVVVGDRYYFIANSHWPSFAKWRTPVSKLSAPLLLMLALR